jgi:ribosomal protein L20A (L18A)
MDYVVKGSITEKAKGSFEIVVTAKSEKHARALATTTIGSRQGINKSKIEIGSVEKR